LSFQKNKMKNIVENQMKGNESSKYKLELKEKEEKKETKRNTDISEKKIQNYIGTHEVYYKME